MVGGLVEEQEVGLLEQQLAEGHPPPLAAGEVCHAQVARWQVHRVHRDLDLPVEIPEIPGVDLVLHSRLLGEQFLHLFGLDRLAKAGVDLLESLEHRPRMGNGIHHILEHVLPLIEQRLLLEISHGVAVGQPRLSLKLRVDARHDLHERALAGAVAAQETNLGAGIEGEVDVFEQLPLAKLFEEVGDLEDERGSHGRSVRLRWEEGGEELRNEPAELTSWRERYRIAPTPASRRCLVAGGRMMLYDSGTPGAVSTRARPAFAEEPFHARIRHSRRACFHRVGG